ncbi:hypothetical protein LSCM1_00329 [Leishmania martiniquensis]|uniref:Uncharacterized protein n=1 Tax=Leishmania martiniquensis TaxID=1580590 RepID=A0A836K5U0_9TRYP|nr:hypothetical protein LSCM1_00329 [Leishmania martiniquensis]
MEVAQDDLITVTSLQSRLSELQTMWSTTARGQEESLCGNPNSSALMTRTVTDKKRDEDVSRTVQVARGTPRSVAQEPVNPSTLPLASPRSFHRHGPPLSALMDNEDGDQACHNSVGAPHKLLASVGVSFTPHAPLTPPSGTPRAWQRPAANTLPPSSPVRTSQEVVTLPPIRAHLVGTVPATCAQCGAKAVCASVAHCGRCGKSLTTVL